LRDALALARELYGERHLQVALVLNDLGACYSRQEKLVEAEDCHRQALALRRTLPDATPLHAAESLNNLGAVLQSRGKLAEAEPLLREALAIRRERLPADHLTLANVLNNLGTLLKRLGHLDEAEAMLREALEISRRRMGPNHPEMAVLLNNLANLLKQRDRFTEATALLREAISIQLTTFGDQHADVGRARLNLAMVIMAQGDYEDARREATLGLNILRGVFGDRHPDVAFSLHNIAAMMSQRGEPAAAEPMLRDAVEIVDERIGRESDVAAHLRDSLGVTLVRLERYDAAIPVLEEAFDRRREVLGEGHAKVGISGCNLAVARLRSGDAAGAVDEALAVLPILRATKGVESQLATTLLVLVEARMELNDPLPQSEAEELIGEAMTLFQPLYGDGSIHAADAQRVRGVFLTRRGQFGEAEAVLIEAIRSLDSQADRSPIEHRQTRRRAVEAVKALDRAWGRPERAVQWPANDCPADELKFVELTDAP
ncbi:MAG TPA: tetratricopeptide repeat protein, partial [Phycisphaerae bacterium]|nr:tetratricopeptide repeat protein [Phycisphaerae bacterium]